MNGFEKRCYESLYGLLSEYGKDRYSGAIEAQKAVWEDGTPDAQPLLLKCPLPDALADKFPGYNPGEIHADKVKMLLNGMKDMAATALSGMQAVPSIRANMGCGIFPSLFKGILPRLFDDKMPWVVDHLDADQIRRLGEEDIVITDEFKLALEHMAYISEHIEGTGAFVFPLDLQGPFDTAHIVYGDAIFYDMYDDPGLVHHLLDLCCHAIEIGIRECFKLITEDADVVAHYNDVVLPKSRGGLKISEDTSTLLSPAHIDEFVTPYTDRVLGLTGGGYIHYCGRNDHLLKRMLELDKVCGINFGNPDKHNMDSVLQTVSGAGKVYYGYVTKADGEGEAEFFGRVRRSATAADGKCRLLLQYNAEYGRRNEVKEAWATCTHGLLNEAGLPRIRSQ